VDSVIDEAQVGKFNRFNLSKLWAKAGMLQMGNASRVWKSIPPQHRAPEMSLVSQEVTPVKTLGILWCAAEGVFTITFQRFEEEVYQKQFPQENFHFI